MLENGGHSKARFSWVEKLTMGVLAVEAVVCLLVAIVHINVPKPLPGIGALLFILVTPLVLILSLWKAGQRENPPFWHFKYSKNAGFWLMAVAVVAAIGISVLMVLFELILPPSLLSSTFASNLPLIAMGVLAFMMVALVVWLAQVGLKARREFRRWLDTGEW
ncbi:MAG TPA: hypothetical protein VFW17_01030 [Ktedonobacterales bacterium]|jgi:hypothetical protein|nr:hypothetical protein [Ktedonobacterales bacterium]